MGIKILVRYGEIALKGKNRNLFEQQLQNNMKVAVRNYGAEVIRMHGRLLVSGPEEHENQLLTHLSRVFGVTSISTVRETKLDMEQIKETAAALAEKHAQGKKAFSIDTRRSNKHFPLTSPEISRELGSYLQSLYKELVVNLDNPDFTVSVEIGYDRAFVYMDKTDGPGGLPVGVTGKGLLLLSGGIDSPAAGWLTMKRGLSIEALHFHSFPFTSRRSQEKVADLCRVLARYCGGINLHMIQVTEIQKELRARCPEGMGVILLRRMMVRLAEMLSARRKLQALVTGENLGQVASQTLSSIDVISKATEMLILRPLIGMDKKDIMELAEKIDTYDISILPYEDCCTLFVPKNPVTKPKLNAVTAMEAELDMEGLLQEAFSTLETKTFYR